MKNRKNHLFAFSFFTLLIVFIFWQFFFKTMHPFPGNFLRAWYEPWKTDTFVKNTIHIAHKPILSDVFRQTYPFKTLAIDVYKKFQLPLWNPYNGAGMPFLATSNIGLLDPLNLFYFFMPYPSAWSTNIIIQTLLIAFFTYIFCRKIGFRSEAAIFTSICLIFSGVVTTHVPYGIFGVGYSMLPLGLYLLASYLENRRTKIIFFLPICILTLIFSVLPQITFYIIAIFFFYIFIFFKKKDLLFLNSLLLLGIGLAGIQILPTTELFLHANMTANPSSFIFQQFLLPIWHYITIFIPNYFGNPSTYNYWGSADYIETAFSLGLIPLFFFLAFFSRNIKN